ncbi:hypothetical protein [Catellatospora citrea]|uniref:hypothetical protein n=1 Tax=Catellatospora citrea TaxID=53366 RepID=UPI000FF5A54C|nr:hypothetical protein [Catellatospora citrea]RKE12180.1 hypothetical protein C8E86_7117 [Catellatospora citrea]
MRRIFVLPVLIAGLATAAACSPTTDPGIPTAHGSAAAGPSAGSGDLTAYVACIREHGVNVPDPAPGMPARAWIRQQAEADPAFDAADVACHHLLPAGVEPPAPTLSAQELEQLRAFAVCMRAHEIEMTDPMPNGNMRIGGRLEHVNRTQLLADPAFQAAQEACKDKLPAEGGKK